MKGPYDRARGGSSMCKNLRWRSRGWVVREEGGKVGCTRGMATGWKE